MTTMHATAVISAVDKASAVFRRVAASAQAVSGRYATMAQGVQSATRNLSTAFTTPAIIGMTALIARTSEFNKALVGIDIAGIADNMENGIVNFERIRELTAETREEAMRLSKALSLSPTGFVQAGEAALKMGLSADKVAKLMEMSGSVHVQDRDIDQRRATEFLGSMGILFGAGADGRDYNADITQIANQWLGVANLTRTSASRLEEGLRQFAPLYASFGEGFAETASLVGAMVQAGQLDVEAGTAFKSLGVRMLNPKAEGREAMVMAGIDRSKFMDLQAVSSKKAFNNLIRLTDTQLSKKQRAQLQAMLNEGSDKNLFLDPAYQQKLLQFYNKATGARTQEARDRNAERVFMSILAGGGRVKMFELLQELASKLESGELTDQQMSVIGEGRHLSRYKALFKVIDFLRQLHGKVKDVNDEFTQAGNRLWRESDQGRWESAVAAMDRAFARLRASEGVRGLINSFERLAGFIADLPPRFVELGGKAMAASVGLAAAGFALSGISKTVGLLATSPVFRLAAGAGGLLALFGSDIFMGTDRLDARDLPIQQFFGPNAPIWTTIDELSKLGGEIATTFSQLSGLVGDLQSLFGLDPSESLLLKGLREINRVIRETRENLQYIREEFSTGSISTIGERPPPATSGYAKYWGLLQVAREMMLGDQSPPTGMIRWLNPTAGRTDVNVQGEANVNVRVQVDGPGHVVEQSGGGGPVRVPLNTGRSMPDTGPRWGRSEVSETHRAYQNYLTFKRG